MRSNNALFLSASGSHESLGEKILMPGVGLTEQAPHWLQETSGSRIGDKAEHKVVWRKGPPTALWGNLPRSDHFSSMHSTRTPLLPQARVSNQMDTWLNLLGNQT